MEERFLYVYVHEDGIEVQNSYMHLFDEQIIEYYYANYPFTRPKWTLYAEWALHTIAWNLHIQRERTKDVFFEFGNEWFRNLFMKGE